MKAYHKISFEQKVIQEDIRVANILLSKFLYIQRMRWHKPIMLVAFEQLTRIP